MKLLVALLLCLPLAAVAAPDPMAETRYCGEPKRDSRGRIVRRADVLDAFARFYPCPATGQPTRSCRGWQIDHIIPLAVGGCDAVRNLQWLPVEIKTCAWPKCKDRWERNVYQRREGD